MNVLTVLKSDHDMIRELFEQFDHADRTQYDRKAKLSDDIRLELTVHSKVEEEVFYPVIKALNDDGRRMVMQAVKEHRDNDDLLIQIARLDAVDPKFEDRVAALIEDVDRRLGILRAAPAADPEMIKRLERLRVVIPKNVAS